MSLETRGALDKGHGHSHLDGCKKGTRGPLCALCTLCQLAPTASCFGHRIQGRPRGLPLKFPFLLQGTGEGRRHRGGRATEGWGVGSRQGRVALRNAQRASNPGSARCWMVCQDSHLPADIQVPIEATTVSIACTAVAVREASPVSRRRTSARPASRTTR